MVPDFLVLPQKHVKLDCVELTMEIKLLKRALRDGNSKKIKGFSYILLPRLKMKDQIESKIFFMVK